jgi:hypothetical protein
MACAYWRIKKKLYCYLHPLDSQVSAVIERYSFSRKQKNSMCVTEVKYFDDGGGYVAMKKKGDLSAPVSC